MPTKGKTVEATEVNGLTVQDVLWGDWEDDPAVVEVGGFDAELHDPVTDGPLVGYRERTRFEVGPNKSVMYEFETQHGLRSVWGATVLDSKMEHVPEGALVRIEFLGERHGSSGTAYFDYSVRFKLVLDREVNAIGQDRANVIASVDAELPPY